MSSRKIELEYVLNCSPKTLYTYTTLPSGLSMWFADRVDRVGDSLNFFWGKHSEIADVIHNDNVSCVRYQWEKDRGGENYFEFKIEQSDVAKVVSVTISMMVDQDEADEQQALWDTRQIPYHRIYR